MASAPLILLKLFSLRSLMTFIFLKLIVFCLYFTASFYRMQYYGLFHFSKHLLLQFCSVCSNVSFCASLNVRCLAPSWTLLPVLIYGMSAFPRIDQQPPALLTLHTFLQRGFTYGLYDKSPKFLRLFPDLSLEPQSCNISLPTI